MLCTCLFCQVCIKTFIWRNIAHSSSLGCLMLRDARTCRKICELYRMVSDRHIRAYLFFCAAMCTSVCATWSEGHAPAGVDATLPW